jgi:hypothetical protein
MSYIDSSVDNLPVVRYTNDENDDGTQGTSTFSSPGVEEFPVGHQITEDEAQQIAKYSENRLEVKDGHLVGTDADGNAVDIDLSKGISENDIHALHHVSKNFGGKNDDMLFMNGDSGNPEPMAGTMAM